MAKKDNKIITYEKINNLIFYTDNLLKKYPKCERFNLCNDIKNLVYEEWFKNTTSLSEGIWIGNGITNQFTIKISNNERELREELTNEFGYNIKKGKGTLIKFISNDE